MPVGDIQHYMGHASLSTTEIYMHFAPKHDAAERLTEALWWCRGDGRGSKARVCGNYSVKART